MNLESLIVRRAGKVNCRAINIASLVESNSGALHLVLEGKGGVGKSRVIPAPMRRALDNGLRNASLDSKLRL